MDYVIISINVNILYRLDPKSKFFDVILVIGYNMKREYLKIVLLLLGLNFKGGRRRGGGRGGLKKFRQKTCFHFFY